MKKLMTILLIFVAAFGLTAFTNAGPYQGQNPCTEVTMGGSCVLQSGETLPSDMVLLWSSAVMEDGSTVNGDVVVIAGSLQVDGEIGGDLVLVGGSASLGSTARVAGSVNNAGGHLDKAEGAVIEGSENTNITPPVIPPVPAVPGVPDWDNPSQDWWNPANLFMGAMWWLARSILWALLALLVVLAAPVRIRRTADAIIARPVEAGGLGLLTVLIVPLLLALVAITICGIPFTLAGALVLVIAWGLGVVAMGYETGRRLTGLGKQDVAPAVSAGLGTFLLTLVMNGVGAVIPCIGWLVPALVGSVGLGAVMLTRFGGELPEAGISGSAVVDLPDPSVTRIIDEPIASDGNDDPTI